jgi:hypothetical protein
MAGTISRGIRAPIVSAGDDIVKIVVDSVLKAQEEDGFTLHEKDIIAVTESVVARADGNYCTVDDIAEDVYEKFGDEIGIVFPILSRNRFAICLRGIARGVKHVILQLSYPADEEGNHLITEDQLFYHNINPYGDKLTERQFRAIFGETKHPFTGVDYIEYYKQIIEEEGAEATIIFCNDPIAILSETTHILCANIHERYNTQRRIMETGNAECVYTLDNIMEEPRNGSGYNTWYGLLGSNKATESSVKLFPKNAQDIAYSIQDEYYKRTGILIEAMVYGDGAFKDPIGKIWELADPVVSPGYTEGLELYPNELKLKYLADNEFKNLKGKTLEDAIRARISTKDSNLKGKMESQGTTPRRVPDLVGSLCDLTSGSGDKGTPIVVVQNYFDNFAN